MPHFVKSIMEFEPTAQAIQSGNQQNGDCDSLQDKKIKSGQQLILELKKLFALMACGNKKYCDPSPVLRAVVDEFG